MSIESQLNEELKKHMRARNSEVVACIRQLKSKVQETVNAKGFSGAVDDALYQNVIASYVKSLEKAIDEMAAAGDRSAALRARYGAEITYLQNYLPKLLDETQTRALVRQAIGELAIQDAKASGKVIGHLMKTHKGQLDTALVRRLIEAELSPA